MPVFTKYCHVWCGVKVLVLEFSVTVTNLVKGAGYGLIVCCGPQPLRVNLLNPAHFAGNESYLDSMWMKR